MFTEDIYIPENELGITYGYYDQNGFADLLRKYCTDPDAIQFLADMLEA